MHMHTHTHTHICIHFSLFLYSYFMMSFHIHSELHFSVTSHFLIILMLIIMSEVVWLGELQQTAAFWLSSIDHDIFCFVCWLFNHRYTTAVRGVSSPKILWALPPSAPSSPSPFSPFSETKKIRTSYRPTFEIYH